MFRSILFVSLFLFLLHPPSYSSAAPVKTGAEVLADSNFCLLKDKKFGVVTNSAATIRGVGLLDVIASAGLRPAVIFAPEHGLREKAEDGVTVADGFYAGIPVKSLYGGSKKPRVDDLEGLDLLVLDFQDVGARCYTYISTMGLVMEAAAEAHVPLVVLDRPNPLGGDYVAGFVRHDLPASFTSLYPIPVAHGMTIGELALMIKGEHMLPGVSNLDLTVVRMEGWQRCMRWPDTGLPWVPTSPNIADFEASLLYPGMCLLEGTAASAGRGTDTPFALAGLPGIDEEALAAKLNAEELPGLRFKPVRFMPVSIRGKSSSPKFRNRLVHGVRIEITDYRAVLPVETGVAVVAGIYAAMDREEQRIFFRKGFDDLAGSLQLRQSMQSGEAPGGIASRWSSDVNWFMALRDQYLLYEDR